MKRILFSMCIFLIFVAFSEAGVSNKDAQFIQASKDGNMKAVQTLLAKGADVNAKYDGWTALMWAAFNGHTEIVKVLLEKGADVNTKETPNGVTALMDAVLEGHT
jgi:uncharacterized protein